MPEGPSNVEIAHHLHEHGKSGGHEESHARRRETIIEIAEAVLLAVVAIATAWSGYQSALWDGHSAKLYGTSSRIRIQATQAETRAGQEQLYDATTVNSWLQAKLTGDNRLASKFEERFRIEFRPAFNAWLATNPLNNPHAQPGPSFMPQYRNALAEQSAALDKHASEAFEEGSHARETGDKYVRTTVLLATVLFLIAVSQRFAVFTVRTVLLIVALLLLGVAINSVVRYPRL